MKMTKETILKDCEFDAAYKIWCLLGSPMSEEIDEYEGRLGSQGLITWVKERYPDSFMELSEAFKIATSNLCESSPWLVKVR